MPVDYAALARSVGTVPGVQACLVLSRDGLALAAEPPAEEGKAMAAWARIGALGDVEKGFVTVNGQMWVFSRRGPFCAIALADATARAGVVLTQLDQVLLAADEDRVRSREEIRSGTQPAPGTGSPAQTAAPDPSQPTRFRAPLHRERDREPSPPSGAPPAPEDRPAPQPEGAPKRAGARNAEDWEIDVVELSREFGGLYGESKPEESDE